MLDKFYSQNKIDNINNLLGDIDTDSAHKSAIENHLFTALNKSNHPNRWAAYPIAPYAEPINLDDLVGDLFNGALMDLSYHANRIDNVYSWLSDANNLFKSEMESVEKIVIEATDNVKNLATLTAPVGSTYSWIADTFNNTAFIDSTTSTCLVDTDLGMVTLGPKALNVISNFTIQVDHTASTGIPGCNLLILNQILQSDVNKEPNVQLETTDSRNISAIIDNDPSTWFEIERNFIPLNQALNLKGRSYVYSTSGVKKNVQTVTTNYDWLTKIQWPDYLDTGTDGTGVSIAEFTDLEGRSTVAGDSSAKLVFTVAFDKPTILSSVSMNPFIRSGSSPIKVDFIQALIGNDWIDIARDIFLGTDLSTTALESQILKRTGTQSVGSVYVIPTTLPITSLKISLSSIPYLTQYGFGHIYQDRLTQVKTTRHYIIFSSTDTSTTWRRQPFNSVPPTLTSTAKPGIKLSGSVIDIARTGLQVGNIFNSYNKYTPVQQSNTITSELKTVGMLSDNALKMGGSLGSAAAWLGKVAPYVGIALAAVELIGKLFEVDQSIEVKQTIFGYDVFKGWRASVGLRDITCLNVTYVNSSVVQTVKRTFDSPVKKIGLVVDESIPSNWGAGEWIKYYLSVDGSVWTPVTKLLDSNIDSAYTPEQPTTSIYLRAVISGNPSDSYHTPQLNNYALAGVRV